MQSAGRLSSKTVPLLVGIVTLALSACVLGPTADPGLARVIKAHYASHATEEDGKCRTPEIDTIQSNRSKGKSGAGDDVVTVRYSYYDRHVDMDANWNALVHLTQPCGGIAERDFSLTQTELGYRVTDMTGERREGGRIN